MTGTSVLAMLFGAALVAIGVLAAAIADKIRGVRATRDQAPAQRSIRAPRTIEVVEASPQGDRRSPASRSAAECVIISKDVITALVAAGYKRPVAAAAVDACTTAERATPESWTSAALRRARGGLS